MGREHRLDFDFQRLPQAVSYRHPHSLLGQMIALEQVVRGYLELCHDPEVVSLAPGLQWYLHGLADAAQLESPGRTSVQCVAGGHTDHRINGEPDLGIPPC